ncbi:MAG: hypothetical protein KF893_21480 [Caldilineaceae bacterium]|nr:hypothetical protein [Caldilineaceae bacterium]
MTDKVSRDDSSRQKNVQEMERIREIVFGAQMRSYDQNFATLRQDLSRLQSAIAQIQEQMSKQEQEQSRRLQALRRELNESDELIRAELRQVADQLSSDKTDRSTLGELLVDLGNQIKAGSSLSHLLQDLFESDEQLES